MDNFNFWKKYLYFISFLLIAMGIFVAFFKDTNIYKLFSQYIDPVFWPDNVIPKNTMHFKSFIYSFSGTYVLLWGINLLFISRFAFKPDNKWAWYSIFITSLVWICIMFPFSLYYGVMVNVYGDIIFFIMIILPLIFTRKYFFKMKN
jgi:hypothetical protein